MSLATTHRIFATNNKPPYELHKERNLFEEICKPLVRLHKSIHAIIIIKMCFNPHGEPPFTMSISKAAGRPTSSPRTLHDDKHQSGSLSVVSFSRSQSVSQSRLYDLMQKRSSYYYNASFPVQAHNTLSWDWLAGCVSSSPVHHSRRPSSTLPCS